MMVETLRLGLLTMGVYLGREEVRVPEPEPVFVRRVTGWSSLR